MYEPSAGGGAGGERGGSGLAENREPRQDLARSDAPRDFVHPAVVEGHPRGTLVHWDVAGLDALPEERVFEALVAGGDTPSAAIPASKVRGTAHVLTGLMDHRPLVASFHSWTALERTLPLGGERT